MLLQDLWTSIWIKIKGKNTHFLLVWLSINNSLRFSTQSQNCFCRLVNPVGTKGHISDLRFSSEIVDWGWELLYSLGVWLLQWWLFQWRQRRGKGARFSWLCQSFFTVLKFGLWLQLIFQYGLTSQGRWYPVSFYVPLVFLTLSVKPSQAWEVVLCKCHEAQQDLSARFCTWVRTLTSTNTDWARMDWKQPQE